MVKNERPINYIGPITEHSSIRSDGERVIKRYEPDDTVGDFIRQEIDRSGSGMLREFRNEISDPILVELIDKAKKQGSIAILDAGCGTGNTLFEIRDQILFRTKLQPSDVLTVGVNDQDFSQESNNWQTRKAIADQNIKYIVKDLETVDLVPNSLDFITSYETFIHNPPRKTARIIANLLPALKSDGVLVFNITPDQRENPWIRGILKYKLKEFGFNFFEYSLKDWKEEDTRSFVWIRSQGIYRA